MIALGSFKRLIGEHLDIAFSLKRFFAQVAADDIAVLDAAVTADCGPAGRFGSDDDIGSFHSVNGGIAFSAYRFIVFVAVDDDDIIFTDDALDVTDALLFFLPVIR